MGIEDAFGIVIRRLRKERNLSQDKLSAMSGLDRKFISNIEAGKQQPSLVSIWTLAEALQCAASTIMFECEFIFNLHSNHEAQPRADRKSMWFGGAEARIMTTDNSYAGTETILLVDDDEPLREALRDVLTLYGYSVLLAVDGQDAFSKFTQFGDDIDMVVMDVVMPRKDGVAAYKEMKRIRGDAKICLMSGYSRGLLEYSEEFIFLDKPFEPLQLVKVIRETLDAK